MYLDFLVKIPFVQGKITRRKKKDAVYVEYDEEICVSVAQGECGGAS